MKVLLVFATEKELIKKMFEKQDILITGVGTINTVYELTKKIDSNNYDFIINAGIAGSYSDSIKIGEVLEVGTVYDDFYGGPVSNHPPMTISDSNIKLFSTDTFYEQGEPYSNHYNRMVNECDIIEMEGYSIAKVCSSENISLSLYKWVSDDGSNSEWLENAKAGFENFKIIFKEKFL